MRCRQARQLISLYVVPDERWLPPEDRQALEAHLAMCESCRQDCRESREAIAILQAHWSISSDTAALLKAGHRQGRHKTMTAIVRLPGVFRRAAVWAAAACVVLAGLVGWTCLNRGVSSPVSDSGEAFTGESLPVVVELADGGQAASGNAIETLATETKRLVLNGKHQVLMNIDTRLAIYPLVEKGRVGCRVDLILGEICVHVEHDGNPFIVQTAHGRAVITGTTFDVKATETDTTLVVAEGSVRFESNAGTVQVTAGQQSMIAMTSLSPSPPVVCDSAALMAWTGTHRGIDETTQTIGEKGIPLDGAPLFDAASVVTDVQGICYTEWLEQNREWFRRQFPGIFRLRRALAGEGIESGYPELLLESGLLWRFAYPPVGPNQLLAVEDDVTIGKAAKRYGKDRQWLTDRGLLAIRVAPDTQKQMMEAFALWEGQVAAGARDNDELSDEVLLNSLHAFSYLRQTRTLICLAIEAGQYSLSETPRFHRQADLEAEVAVLSRGLSDTMRLLTTKRSEALCDSDSHRQLVEGLRKAIVQVVQTEEKLTNETANCCP